MSLVDDRFLQSRAIVQWCSAVGEDRPYEATNEIPLFRKIDWLKPFFNYLFKSSISLILLRSSHIVHRNFKSGTTRKEPIYRHQLVKVLGTDS